MELPEGVRRERIEPLWDRVDRNRVKVAGLIAAYIAAVALTAAVLAGVVAFIVLLIPLGAVLEVRDLATVVAAATQFAVLVASAWVAYAMLRAEPRLLGNLGAQRTETGKLIPTKMVLKDMAIAAGLRHAPALWIVPECDRVNAFAVGRTHATSVIGVTQGFVDRLSLDDQRAVFANLVARLCNGDVRWATAVSTLVGPFWRQRDRQLRREDDHTLPDEDPEWPGRDRARERRVAMGTLLWVLGGVVLVALVELLLAGHERQAMLTAEKADAEGMLLLKDPRSMLRALETVLEANNTVPSAGEAYSDLFYCWAGFGFAPEDDPEFERVARLREVLGPEGLAERPGRDFEAEAAALLPPVAPWVEEEAEGKGL